MLMASTLMPPMVQRLHFDNMNIKQTYSRSDDSLTGRESSLQRKLRAKAMKHQNLQLCDESKKKSFYVPPFHELLLVFWVLLWLVSTQIKKHMLRRKLAGKTEDLMVP